jgi:hypothetical protein
VDNPWRKHVDRVLQFSKHYHHIKFQAIISNSCRVLEAISSERWDAAVFGSSMVAQKISSKKTKFLSIVTLSSPCPDSGFAYKCCFRDIFKDSGQQIDL